MKKIFLNFIIKIYGFEITEYVLNKGIAINQSISSNPTNKDNVRKEAISAAYSYQSAILELKKCSARSRL